MDFIWIIAGIIYVVYKLQKEEHFFSKEVILPLLGFLAWVYIPWLIAYGIAGEDVANIVVLITFAVPFFIFIVLGLFFSISGPLDKSQRTDIIFAKDCENLTVSDMQSRFEACGYKNVSANQIEKLLKDPISPIRCKDNRKVLIFRCYKWLCDMATWDIMRKSDKGLGEALGVPIKEIPLDPKVELGLGILKRRALARNYILRQEGLRYKGDYLIHDEYYDFFDKFVEDYIKEHQAVAQNNNIPST